MPIPTVITDLSTTAASNYPAGSESPAVLDDVQRAHAAFIAQLRDNPSANATTPTPVAKGGTGAITAAAARANLGVAPRSTRIDVASVAGTVDLTANAPNTDDIRITGALAITAFTVASDRVIRVTAGGAFTLINSANLVTQTGANVVCVAGDTFMLRATGASIVEVLTYTRTTLTIPDLSITGAKIAASTITPDKLSGGQFGGAPAFAARAWTLFNGATTGTNAPIAGGNVTSVTRNGTGDYTITFSTAMPTINYAVSGIAIAQAAGSVGAITIEREYTSSSYSTEFRIVTKQGGTFIDPQRIYLTFIG